MPRQPIDPAPGGTAPTGRPGFFGKVPARGDFVGHGLDDRFRTTFDTWLQRSLATSKRQLGAAWLPAYLNTPIWRFVLGPGLCAEDPSAGVMIPSVDRVGRYFPLVLAAPLPGCSSPGTLFHGARDWFDRAEALILTTLDDGFRLEGFDAAVAGLGLPPYATAAAQKEATLRLELQEGGDMSAAYAHILDRVLMGGGVDFSLWWTLGSEKVRASVLLGNGLPPPGSFSAFLDGNWAEWGWEHPPGAADRLGDLPLLFLKPIVAVPSAGRTHPGSRRTANEDAMLLRPDLGLWAVADGAGGHQAPAEASRTVVEHLDRLLPPLSFRSMVDDVTELLGEANTALQDRAATLRDGAVMASTVVVLLIYAGQYAVIWSGDSRVYRLRGGVLERLTRDHAAHAGAGVASAIGAAPDPAIEVEHGGVELGDRFLLCSDGVTKVLDDAELAEVLGRGEPAAVVEALTQESLIAGARDNITAVVVGGA